MKGYLYTDLACEAWESDEKNKTSRKTPISDNISYSKTVISTQEEEKRYQQAKGTYTTFFTPQLGQLDHRSFELLCDSVGRELRNMLQSGVGGVPLSFDFSVLVVGIGNGAVTADAIGPETAKQVFVTRHLLSTQSAKKLGRCSVSAFVPDVLGNTGIETLELIRGAVQAVRPDAVIAVDSLVAKSYERLATTIQVSDGGISPGSGLGYHRKAICRQTLGCPVIAVGIPTVVNSSTLISDVLEQSGMAYPTEALRQILENGRSFFVMPQESDQIVKSGALVLSCAIDRACTLATE